MIKWSDLVFESRRPVDDEGERRGLDGLRADVHQESRTVGGHIVLMAKGSTERCNLEQRLGSAHFELRAGAVYRNGHQLVVGRNVEELAAVTPPMRIPTSAPVAETGTFFPGPGKGAT